MTCRSKIVVFDLDETLGYFMELGMFWDALNAYIKNKHLKITIDQYLFNGVLNLYPEFLRPNIIDILNYLKLQKQNNYCDKLMIYTNNQGPVGWTKHIMNYFEQTINYNLFDQIIGAFKIQGKNIELCRTTHLKTHKDFIKCTKVSKNTQICFIDDAYYPDMSNDNIYYINVKPYIHDLSFDIMISRLLNSSILGLVDDPIYCREYILSFMNKYNYIYITKTQSSQMIDTILSKKILQHLHIFFKMKPIASNITKNTKRHKIICNKTLKRHKN